jgi:hypothetical protein
MANSTVGTVVNDQRQFARVPFTGAVTYRYEPDHEGTAMCTDVGRGGLCLHLGRYLRPGRRVMLSVAGPDGEPLELKARVAWCRATPGSRLFATGVRVYHDEPQSLGALSTMVHKGLEQSGVFSELRALHKTRTPQPRTADGRKESATSREAWVTVQLGQAVAAVVITMAMAPLA